MTLTVVMNTPDRLHMVYSSMLFKLIGLIFIVIGILLMGSDLCIMLVIGIVLYAVLGKDNIVILDRGTNMYQRSYMACCCCPGTSFQCNLQDIVKCAPLVGGFGPPGMYLGSGAIVSVFSSYSNFRGMTSESAMVVSLINGWLSQLRGVDVANANLPGAYNNAVFMQPNHGMAQPAVVAMPAPNPTMMSAPAYNPQANAAPTYNKDPTQSVHM